LLGLNQLSGLKELQTVYQSLAVEAQTTLLEHGWNNPPHATSPMFFNLSHPCSRARSHTSPNPFLEHADLHKQFAVSFFHLDHKYKISWECAGLLIELGGSPLAPPPVTANHSGPACGGSVSHSSRDSGVGTDTGRNSSTGTDTVKDSGAGMDSQGQWRRHGHGGRAARPTKMLLGLHASCFRIHDYYFTCHM